MGYFRVCPRDLFNESKLLKCLGLVSLCIHDGTIQGLTMNHENEKEGFTIVQNDATGGIYVSNLHFFDNNGTPVEFYHPLNNKGPFPLIMEYKGEEYWPFNDKGDFQCDKNIFKGKKK